MSSPAFSFGYRGLDLPDKKGDIPGPGAYYPQSQSFTFKNLDKAGSQQSIGSKVWSHTERALDKPSGIPGPGSYETGKSQRLGYGYSFSTADKSKAMLIKHMLLTPGPYSVPPKAALYSPQFTFGRRIKAQDAPAHKPDNDQFYELNTSFKKVVETQLSASFSKGSRTNILVDPHIPGPGAYSSHIYDSIESPQSNKGTIFTQGPRVNFLDKEAIRSPGPGSYEWDKLKSTVGVRLAQAPRTERTDTVISPGPKYDVSGIGDKKIGAKMPSSPRFQNGSVTMKVPSPVAYSPKAIEKHASAASLGKGLRPDIAKSKAGIPGPGSYFPELNVLSSLKSLKASFRSPFVKPA